jgi:CheY-like chemotaxis protein
MNSNPMDEDLRSVLLVEDNSQDLILTREGFREAQLHVDLHHVVDGVECLAFLRREGKYHDAPGPDLILLDLNLPRMNGREVLAELVQDEDLRHIPVIVLSTSSADADVIDMYRLRCSSYMIKPVVFSEFVDMVRSFGKFWFDSAKLPRTDGQTVKRSRPA